MGRAAQDDLEKQATTIYSALSDRESLRLFELAAKGFAASVNAYGNLRLSKKRYYTRLRELLELGLIQKQGGMYRHTALGTVIYENEVQGLKRILWSRGSIEILQTLKNQSGGQDSRAIVDQISHELLKDVETRLGLSGLRPVRLFRSWDSLIEEVSLFFDRLRSDLYLATRYVDFRTAESALRSASRGCKIHIIHSNRGGLSPRLQILGNLMANPKVVPIFWNLVRHPNLTIVQAEVPYSFIVADGLDVGIEILDPSDPHSFFLGVQFESPTLAQRLISYFKEQEKVATKGPTVETFQNALQGLLGSAPNGRPA